MSLAKEISRVRRTCTSVQERYFFNFSDFSSSVNSIMRSSAPNLLAALSNNIYFIHCK